MKTIIWDYNGTIIDDVKLCLDVEKFMLKEREMFSNTRLKIIRICSVSR